MKTFIFFLVCYFFFTLSISSQKRIEILSLVKMDLPDENKQSMFKCEDCYIILDNCYYDSCARILEEYFPPEIIERKKYIPEGYELFFLFDKDKKVGVIHILQKEKICRTFSWFDKTPLDVFYSPRY